MNMLNINLQTIVKRAGYLALACGLLAPAGLGAQSSYSSSSNDYALNNPSSISPQYSSSGGGQQYGNNPQYRTNPQYGNQPYDNQQQYGNRTPRYTGHSWTDHFLVEAGAGGTTAAGVTQNYANPGFNVLLGAGVRFNNRLSLLAEWNFNYLGVPHSLAAVVAGTPDGNEHIWTADLNPKIDVIREGRAGLYVIGGGGFSRALTNFTVPVVFNCYDWYWGGYPCSGNITVAHTSSNQANWDAGAGIDWNFSPYEPGQFFIEARYVKLFTPNNGLPPGYDAKIIPVTLGVRW